MSRVQVPETLRRQEECQGPWCSLFRMMKRKENSSHIVHAQFSLGTQLFKLGCQDQIVCLSCLLLQELTAINPEILWQERALGGRMSLRNHELAPQCQCSSNAIHTSCPPLLSKWLIPAPTAKDQQLWIKLFPPTWSSLNLQFLWMCLNLEMEPLQM